MTQIAPIAFPFDGDIPPEGIWEGTSDAEYRAWPSFAQSDIKDHLQGDCPAKVEWRRQHPLRDTEATYLGTGLHAYLFERERFDTLILPPPINKNTGKPYGDDSKAYREFAEAHPDACIVDEDGLRLIRLLGERILKVPAFRRAYEHPNSLREVPLSFYLPLRTPTGETVWVAGKCKPDLWGDPETLNDMWDLKSINSATERAFGVQAGRLGYHYQGTYYSAAGERLTGRRPTFHFLAFEKMPTHQVVPYRLTPETFDLCFLALQRSLLTLAGCAQKRQWPGVSAQPRDLVVPRHWMPHFSEEEYLTLSPRPGPIDEDPVFDIEEEVA